MIKRLRSIDWGYYCMEYSQYLVLPFIGFPIVFSIWLDGILKPRMNSIQDEGVYFFYIIFGFVLEFLAVYVVLVFIKFIRWIKNKLKML